MTNRLSSSATDSPDDKNRPWEPFDAVVACLTRQSPCIQEKRGSNMLESEFQIGNSGLMAKYRNVGRVSPATFLMAERTALLASRRLDRRTLFRLGFAAAAAYRLSTSPPPGMAQQDARIPRDVKPTQPRHGLSKEEIRPKLRELLGLDPIPNEVPLLTTKSEASRDGLELTVLAYRNLLGETVPGVLAVPADADTGSLGGVVCLSGTGGSVGTLTDARFGNQQPGKGRLMGWGRELARRGFATLSITLRGTTSRHISPMRWEQHSRFPRSLRAHDDGRDGRRGPAGRAHPRRAQTRSTRAASV